MKKLSITLLFCSAFALAYAQAPVKRPVVKQQTKQQTARPAEKPAAKPATQTPAAQTGDPGYTFDQTSYDYGTLEKGGNPYCQFQLTNTSKEPLIIKEAHGSCGCTIPEYPKEPIQPGQTVTIKVHYDTNRIGPFAKQVTVTFEGKSTPAILHIKGTVQAPPSETPFPGPGSAPANGGIPVNH